VQASAFHSQLPSDLRGMHPVAATAFAQPAVAALPVAATAVGLAAAGILAPPGTLAEHSPRTRARGRRHHAERAVVYKASTRPHAWAPTHLGNIPNF
jgi:hypothetical protein